MLRLYNPRPRITSNWIAGVLVCYGIAVLGLVGLGSSTPDIVIWLTDAAQTEFVAPDQSAPPRTLIAQSVGESHRAMSMSAMALKP